jgi:hypothetical protein
MALPKKQEKDDQQRFEEQLALDALLEQGDIRQWPRDKRPP